MKTHYNIYFRNPGMDSISLPEPAFQLIEQSIMDREDTMLKAGGITFSPRDIRYVKRITMPSSEQQPESYPEISEDKRRENLLRLHVLRDEFFNGKRRRGEEWPNPYSPDDIRSTMPHEERLAFKKEFFDVWWDSDEQTQEALRQWLPYHRGRLDPGAYSRERLISRVRGE